jgi:hypothetical protein
MPSNSLKDKRREVAIESLREESQVGEQVNKSSWRDTSSFRGFIRKNGQSKSSEEISQSSESHWILWRCKEVTVNVRRLKLTRAEPSIPSHKDRQIYT